MHTPSQALQGNGGRVEGRRGRGDGEGKEVDKEGEGVVFKKKKEK